MKGLIEALADNPWVYLLVAASIGGSAVFPPLPSDSLLVTAMGLAAAGELTLAWVVVATLLGGLAGDLLAYTISRILRRPARRRAEQAGRGQAAFHWLEQREHTWGLARADYRQPLHTRRHDGCRDLRWSARMSPPRIHCVRGPLRPFDVRRARAAPHDLDLGSLGGDDAFGEVDGGSMVGSYCPFSVWALAISMAPGQPSGGDRRDVTLEIGWCRLVTGTY